MTPLYLPATLADWLKWTAEFLFCEAPTGSRHCRNFCQLATVVEAMRNGNAYVNVRTNDGVDPPDTGLGDFPGGEIRRQIKAAS